MAFPYWISKNVPDEDVTLPVLPAPIRNINFSVPSKLGMHSATMQQIFLITLRCKAMCNARKYAMKKTHLSLSCSTQEEIKTSAFSSINKSSSRNMSAVRRRDSVTRGLYDISSGTSDNRIRFLTASSTSLLSSWQGT